MSETAPTVHVQRKLTTPSCNAKAESCSLRSHDLFVQEAACHALMSLAESSTDNKEQAKAIITTVQRNLIWALQPQPGARPGTAQVSAVAHNETQRYSH